SAAADDLLVRLLRESCRIAVKEAEDGEDIQPEVVYLAPANYHLLVEKNRTLSLSVDKDVNYSRPSIDVLFETAARSFGEKLVGVLLTGANKDGSLGLKTIREHGGLVVVQDPATAEAPIMPLAAIETTEADYILTIQKIADLLERLGDGE
ncbi:MAG: chemotaxis protein CheB, partial [Proteobacteria bacterium]|nr:chemotaxis protein CheB [Pseudomonadota bacterium]